MILHIGKSYIKHEDGLSKLCADLTVENRRTTLWFGVDPSQEKYLSLGRADAFVTGVITTAMYNKYSVVCEDPLSERLHHQLESGLIPTLSFAGTLYHQIKIDAPLTSKRIPNEGAVGTGFTGGVDSLYTVMMHGDESEYPLTHVAMFRHYATYKREVFKEDCRQSDRFAKELGLGSIYVDTNLGETFGELYRKVYTFRNIACILAVQGLFSVYLISSGHSVSELTAALKDLEDPQKASSHYDPITISCASTESTSFYLSGGETIRADKLEAMTSWEPSKRWLHPCLRTQIGQCNCGRCKKCSCDLAELHALGMLDEYRQVFDVDDYLKHFPQQAGFLLAREGSEICKKSLQMLKEHGIQIPRSSYVFAKQIKLAQARHDADEQSI